MVAEGVLRLKEKSRMLQQEFISDSTSRITSPSSPTLISRYTQTLTQYLNRSNQNLTLFEMMTEDQQQESELFEERDRESETRISKILLEAPFQNPRHWGFGSCDVKLTVVGKFRVSMDVHRSVLAEKSQFFAEKLRQDSQVSNSVEIRDCEDVEVYVETVILMYCEDLKRKLMGEEICKVLSLLKASAAIMFESGIMSCLEYLEAVPWTEEEQEKVISCLNQLHLHDYGYEVFHRVTSRPSTSTTTDDIFLGLLTGFLQAKDDKARREMRKLLSRILCDDSSNDNKSLDVSKQNLYHLCHGCLSSLISCLSEALCVEERRHQVILMADIAREADNIQWIVNILIDRKMGDEFVNIWADQKELAILHSKTPTKYRHEISRITAQLCIAIGRGRILVPKEARFSLLSTWLEALYGDFRWMRTSSRNFDTKLVEDGLGQTILTLPLPQQQAILLNWFDRFLNKGDDCPNIHEAFEVWWRRAFIRKYGAETGDSPLQMTVRELPY